MAAGYDKMVGESNDNNETEIAAGSSRTYYIPLIFWFNRHAGVALPLIA
jgi:hypothetical protein